MAKPIVIIGKNGQIGSALIKLLSNKSLAFSHSEYDFSEYENITSALYGVTPKAIINACAYTNVDQAEKEVDQTWKANVKVPEALAKYCKKNDIPFIHYSTDYVFSGDGNDPYKEDAPASPLNKYGESKLAGEEEIQKTGGKYLIFRTSWVYDALHKNFLTAMLALAKEREELSIVSDQTGAPSFANDIAKETLRALYNTTDIDEFPSGIYNLCNAGQTNWHEYASEIFDIARQYGIELKIKKVNAIPTLQYPTPAKRPLNSRLDCSKAKSVLKIDMPEWHVSLEECMEQFVENNRNTIERPAGS